MGLKFTKMQGLGNDFLVLDMTTEASELSSSQIRQLADRRTGVGFDQLLIIAPPRQPQADFVYRIFNADGKEVEQCGNGARCVGRYIFDHQLTHKKIVTLETLGGYLEVSQDKEGMTVNMGRPILAPEKIPFLTPAPAQLYSLPHNNEELTVGVVSLGNPHAVLKVEDVKVAPVETVGKFLQTHPAFPAQINVGFMEIITPHSIRLRVFERGVGETLACGSGACAAAVIGRLCYNLGPEVTVELKGGPLKVKWERDTDPVYLTGPAEYVFRGELLID